MGRDIRNYSFSWSVSRHNSDEDVLHDELEEEMLARIRAIINDPRYKCIGPMD